MVFTLGDAVRVGRHQMTIGPGGLCSSFRLFGTRLSLEPFAFLSNQFGDPPCELALFQDLRKVDLDVIFVKNGLERTDAQSGDVTRG